MWCVSDRTRLHPHHKSLQSLLSVARRCHKKAWREPNRRKSVFHNRIMWISWFSSCGFSNTWRCDWIRERGTLNSILLLTVLTHHLSIITTFMVLIGPNRDASWTSVCGQISICQHALDPLTYKSNSFKYGTSCTSLTQSEPLVSQVLQKIQDVNASGRQCQPGGGLHFIREWNQ